MVAQQHVELPEAVMPASRAARAPMAARTPAATPFRTDFHALPFRTGAAFPLPPMTREHTAFPRERSLPRRDLPSRVQTRWEVKPRKPLLEPLVQPPSNRWLTSFAPPLDEPLPVLAIQFAQIVEGHNRFETLSGTRGDSYLLSRLVACSS